MYYPNIPLQLAKSLTVLKSRANVWYIQKNWKYIVNPKRKYFEYLYTQFYSYSPTLTSSTKIWDLLMISQSKLISSVTTNNRKIQSTNFQLTHQIYCFSVSNIAMGNIVNIINIALCFARRLFVCLTYFYILVRLFIVHPCLVDRK